MTVILLLLLLAFSSSLADDNSGFVLRRTGVRAKRQMMSMATKWGNGQINYYFVDTNNEQKKTMWTGMDYIKNRTCIKFVENPNADQKLMIYATPRSGCNAPVGAPGTRATMRGTEMLAFGNCPIVGSVVHELTHTLGSFHEHTRPDRDQWITVDEAAVKRVGQERNMNIQPWATTKMYVPFEYGSVMMYDVMKYGERIMTPKNIEYDRTMGNRRIGFYDIERINKFYGCKCATELPCDNGGYTNPSDCSWCVCPSGFFGKLCNERPARESFELAADSEWQSKTIWFTYINTGDNYAYFYSTFAYITAPDNTTIEIELERLDNLTCQYGCNVNGVEIKTKPDRKSISPIVCCPDQEFAEQTFKSQNNPTIIEMYTKSFQTSAVGFRYRYV